MSAPPALLRATPALQAALTARGIATVEDLLRVACCLRDLPDRSNHVLELPGGRVFVKREKSPRPGTLRPSREAAALRRAAAAGVPVPALLLEGADARLGAVAGTADLAPARPLDDLLCEGALGERERRRALLGLARAAAALHRAGLSHRDLYLNHVFVAPDGRVAGIIDWHRLRRHRLLLGPRVIKDLGAIHSSVPRAAPQAGRFEQDLRSRFLLRYLRLRRLPARGLAPPLARLVACKAARIRAHLPRTPVGEAPRPRPLGGRA